MALVLLLAASVVVAQRSRDVVTDKISVTVVEVPVQVLKKGQPVAGLGAQDFVVLDRGVRREIVDFSVLDLSAPSAASSEEDRPAPRGRTHSRHLLLLIDLDFTDWRVLPRSIQGAQEMVEGQLDPTDKVAIGFLSPTVGAQLLHDFTLDRRTSLVALEVLSGLVDRDTGAAGLALEELAHLARLDIEGMDEDPEAWRNLARRWLSGSSQPIGTSPLIADQEAFDPAVIDGSGPLRNEPQFDPVVDRAIQSPSLFDEQTFRRLLYLGKTLRSLTLSLSQVPEPKQVLLFSAGVPARFLDSRDHATRTLARLDLVVKACLETGWVVHAIDVRRQPSIDEPAFDGNALFHLASQTGGELFEHYNRIGAATAQIVERSRITYLLVIQPDVEADGGFHDLEVRLAEPIRGSTLHHRRGYRAPTPAGRRTRLDDRRDVAELILAKTKLEDFKVELLTMPVPAIQGRGTVPVVLEIPGEPLLENPFGETVSLEVHAYGLDAQGGIQDLFVKRLDVDLRRSGRRLARGGLRVVGQLDLGEGSNEVRVLVRNLANDALSLVSAEVQLPTFVRGSLAVLPPVFVDQSRDWVSLHLDEGGGESAQQTLGTAYFPVLKPSMRRRAMQPLVLGVYMATEASPRLEMRVLSALGEEMEGPRFFLGERFERLDGGLGLTATLEPRGLAPGGYTLEVALVDPASGQRVANSHRFVIEDPS